MSQKNIIIKITIFTLFFLLLINTTKIYAVESDEINKLYDKVETEEGTFYKYKETDKSNIITPYPSSTYTDKTADIASKVQDILNIKLSEYLKKYTSDECPDDQKIADNFYIGLNNLYYIDDENNFTEGDDISLLACVFAEPINGSSDYWKENFSNNELIYDEIENKYSVRMYYFIRLSKSSDTGEYEIAYIDFKPENYDEYVSEFKKNKGIDLENLDVEKILNTEYADEITVVSSSNTISVSGNKTEYNSAKSEDVSKISIVIRTFCTLILSICIITYIIKKCKTKQHNSNL
jgi:hypothetical protein